MGDDAKFNHDGIITTYENGMLSSCSKLEVFFFFFFNFYLFFYFFCAVLLKFVLNGWFLIFRTC